MGDEPRSAYEIAMEKLRARDAERGEEPGRKLNAAMKAQLAEIRKFYEAKLAEREILFRSERKKLPPDPEKLKEAEENYRTDRRRLESERDSKIEKIKAG